MKQNNEQRRQGAAMMLWLVVILLAGVFAGIVLNPLIMWLAFVLCVPASALLSSLSKGE
jgi:predicted nucleic acid-binding Zn ribbon protein